MKSGELIWYAPDHDLRPARQRFVSLFAVDGEHATSGTRMLAYKACIIPFVPRRKPDGEGADDHSSCDSPPLERAIEATAAWMNKIVEQCIMMAPDQYNIGCIAALKLALKAYRRAVTGCSRRTQFSLAKAPPHLQAGKGRRMV